MLCEMKHQCDLSESDLRIRPNQIRHTILCLKQVHRTQYQNTYQLGTPIPIIGGAQVPAAHPELTPLAAAVYTRLCCFGLRRICKERIGDQ